MKIISKVLEVALERAQVWTVEPYDYETREIVSGWIEIALTGDNEAQENIIEAFHKDIEFGTGGMRGICGPGTNRINEAVLSRATQGLANYIKEHADKLPSPLRVAIAYDSRHRSAEFAQVTARVLAGNGIEAMLYPDLRPTPQLSWTVRRLKCAAGIVITASHNTSEYNGFKVYWSDGAQIVEPHDVGIIAEVRKVKSLGEVISSTGDELITVLGKEMDEEYLKKVLELRRSDSLAEHGSEVEIVYTGLHGAGTVSVPPALDAFGFRNVHQVESQATPDGRFPTVSSPNPEEGQALSEAISLAEKVGAKLVMGTDPDADRVGVAVNNGNGGFTLLNGNETGALLFDYVLGRGRTDGEPFNSSYFVASTVVTSTLLAKIGLSYGVGVIETLTGFKHIAAAINSEEGSREFIIGAEESYGYLIADTARDKDAVAACCVLAELAHTLDLQGSSMLSRLEEIHCKHGVFSEGLVSVVKQGRDGAKEIAEMMSNFRSSTPSHLAGERVVALRDFQSSEEKDLLTSVVKKINLPQSNVLQFITELGSRITVRPSGTEPKIKFYVSVNKTLQPGENYLQVREALTARVNSLFEAFETIGA